MCKPRQHQPASALAISTYFFGLQQFNSQSVHSGWPHCDSMHSASFHSVPVHSASMHSASVHSWPHCASMHGGSQHVASQRFNAQRFGSQFWLCSSCTSGCVATTVFDAAHRAGRLWLCSGCTSGCVDTGCSTLHIDDYVVIAVFQAYYSCVLVVQKYDSVEEDINHQLEKHLKILFSTTNISLKERRINLRGRNQDRS